MNAEQPTVAADLVADRVAIVTGGARGIGRATVTTLLANGARVCVADLDGGPAQEIVGEWGEDRALVVPATWLVRRQPPNSSRPRSSRSARWTSW